MSNNFLTFITTYKTRIRNNVKIPKEVMEQILQRHLDRGYVEISCDVNRGKLYSVFYEGGKLTCGWSDFLKDNSFEEGDKIILKYYGLTRFHVERIRPTTGTTSDASAMGDEERFVTLSVTADTLNKSRKFLPIGFCEKNGLFDLAENGVEYIFLVAENRVKYAVKLKVEIFPTVKRLKLTDDLREFLEDNDIG